MESLDLIKQSRLVAVIDMLEREREDVLPMIGALLSGGIVAVELDFADSFSPELMRAAAITFPDMQIGAGGLYRAPDVRSAIAAGARFISSFGYLPEAAEVCREQEILYIPGCVTPTEITAALSGGADLIKFTPASVFGGITTVKTLGKMFPEAPFVVSGGVTEEQVGDYLALRSVVACADPFMIGGTLDETAANTARLVGRYSRTFGVR